MTCEELISTHLEGLHQRFHCVRQDNGRLCLVTPYLYPDHDNVEVFVRDKGDVVVVSDLGETLRRLDTLGMDVLDTPSLFYTAHRIADGFRAGIREGVILKEGARADVGQLVFEVATVCQAVGSLVYGSKAYKPLRFQEEVRAFFTNSGFQFDQKVPVTGGSRTTYRVDFGVWVTRTKRALVEPLSPTKSSGSRRKVNATFRMWVDLGGDRDTQVSLLNDQLVHFGEEDIALLNRVSTVRRWTRRDDLRALLVGLGTRD